MSSLLVAGTTSDAGKSVLVAGICRWLYRQGVKVAPFKAQNMSNNSAVTPDGGEIGRAQALQAAACGLRPDVRFNPVLLKPGSDRQSQVVVLGKAEGTVGARYYRERKPYLAQVVSETLAELRSEYDMVICEGAGSPTEINLRASDIANMGLARAADLPVIVVGDIDRGGLFAHLYGTLALLDAGDQALISGFVINKFRGDHSLLQPGIDQLRELTGRPTYGVLPWRSELWLDAEDSLSYAADGVLGRPAAPVGTQWLRVVAPRLPRLSNGTDLEALACEPGVAVRLVTEPAALADADVVIIPGSKSTVDDLAWLRQTGLADAIERHAAARRPVFGICGGLQMLATRIVDNVESGKGAVPGLGLLPLHIEFAPTKTLATPEGTALGHPVRGYEIHHGQVTGRAADLDPLIATGAGTEGYVRGVVAGTHWHGLLENNGFRREWVHRMAKLAGRTGFQVASDTDFEARRVAQLDLLGDMVEEHLDTGALLRLLDGGAPAGLPLLGPGA
ncbi:cobyric acid synthase [Pseudonocardiaceae bacterium YIM PH 21723]|nr:cobyric acid synthase [Pseudonocardiaceae bacterium YIM PH 21723]